MVNMSNRRGLIFVLIGLIAAVGAGILVYLIANNAAQTTTAVAAPPPTPVSGREVLMAYQDIEANTVVTTSMVATATFPSDLVPSDAYTQTANLIGQTAKIKVFAGHMLLERQFVNAGGRTGSSASVRKGKVLVAFPSTDIINSRGAVQR